MAYGTRTSSTLTSVRPSRATVNHSRSILRARFGVSRNSLTFRKIFHWRCDRGGRACRCSVSDGWYGVAAHFRVGHSPARIMFTFVFTVKRVICYVSRWRCRRLPRAPAQWRYICACGRRLHKTFVCRSSPPLSWGWCGPPCGWPRSRTTPRLSPPWLRSQTQRATRAAVTAVLSSGGLFLNAAGGIGRADHHCSSGFGVAAQFTHKQLSHNTRSTFYYYLGLIMVYNTVSYLLPKLVTYAKHDFCLFIQIIKYFS